MLRSHIADRQKQLPLIMDELRQPVLALLCKKAAEMFTIQELLDELILSKDAYRHSSPTFTDTIYCADYDDILYCTVQIVQGLVKSGVVERQEVGSNSYYGWRRKSHGRH